MQLAELTTEEIDSVFSREDDEALELQHLIHTAVTHPYYTFAARPDLPNDFDEQSGFVDCNYRFDPNARDGKGAYIYRDDVRFKICLGGTGSGKTHAAAYKTAAHVLENLPPRDRCPFWIIGETMDQVCKAAWLEKLLHLIPRSEIHSIAWHREKKSLPSAVMLRYPDRRKDADGNERVGWVLEFKSYEQGLGGMKAESIGGYWFNEEVPYHHVAEVQGRCRDYDSPGWADFTPIECRDPEWPESYERTHDSWRFYHLNTALNDALAPGWYQRYISTIPVDMRELRTIGKFTVLQGAVFKEFRRAIHIIKPFRIGRDWKRLRGIDFGFNNPFCCLWVAKDHDGRYYVYDEHYETQRLNAYHVEKIKLRDWDDSLPQYGTTWSDHDPQQRAELGQLGIPCTPANKAINPGIEFLRSLMMEQPDGKPKIFIFENCVNLIREIPGYKWAEGTEKRNAKDEPMDVDNHAIDALRYIVYSDRISSMNVRPQTRRVIRDATRHGVHLRGRE